MFMPLGLPDPNIFAGLRPLRENETMVSRTMQRLATGRRINAGKDDPAGLITGERLNAAIRALDAESRAIQREASYLATEDGALAATGDMLGELKGLAVEAANSGAMSDAERNALDIEAASIVRAIEHTAGASTFAGQKIFDEPITSEIGAVEVTAGGETVAYTLADVGRGVSLSDNPALVEQIADQAVSDLATMRGEIGATIANELEPRSRAIDTEMLSLAQAHSAIVDADYALETATLARAQMLAQASRFLVTIDARNSGLALDLLAGAA